MKLTLRSIENVALHYVRRYACTEKQLHRFLVAKVDRLVRREGGDRTQALAWVDAAARKLVAAGFANDASYARMKSDALRAAGKSARMISLKLKEKGVGAELARQNLSRVSEDVSEEEAARTFARKKRLGPFRADPAEREERRQRDLAALVRAGFPFTIARQVIDET